jgi:hypothetical protein
MTSYDYEQVYRIDKVEQYGVYMTRITVPGNTITIRYMDFIRLSDLEGSSQLKMVDCSVFENFKKN